LALLILIYFVRSLDRFNIMSLGAVHSRRIFQRAQEITMARLRISSMILFLGVIFLAAVGCGPTLHQPSGKLTWKGGAFKPLPEKGYIMISFAEESDKNFNSRQTVNWVKDGTFKVVGATGKGIPAGKYRVSIEVYEDYSKGPESKDLLNGSMKGEKGPIVEVKDDKTEIVIDLK
jgi:hypothetical protein